MNPPISSPRTDELLGLLAQWQDLSVAEGMAIQREDWNGLEAAQQAKRRLQDQIDSCQPDSPRWNPGTSTRGGLAPSPKLPELVFEWATKLQAQERSNAQLLADKLSAYRERMATLNASVRHLRQVQRAYGNAGSAAWQWYS